MKPLLVALVVLIAAVVAGHYVADDPGFIVIGYGGKVIRTTFAAFMAFLAIAFITLYGLLASLRNIAAMRSRWQQWSTARRHRKAYDSLADGMMLMASGDFAGAERLFRRGIDDELKPAVHYFAAASAAEAQGAPGRRDNYLQLARDTDPEAGVALNIKRAEWLLANDQISEARPLIERLVSTEIGNTQVLELQMRLYQETHDSDALLALMPDLRRDHVISVDEANALERQCASLVLEAETGGEDALKQRWKSLSRYLRAEPEVVGAYAVALARAGAPDEAEALVRKALERQWSSELAAVYGEIPCDPPERQLRRLEEWAMRHADDPGLRLARARQGIRAGQWELAREQLEALMRHRPSPLLYQLLAQIADGLGDTQLAFNHRQRGLELATGEASAGRLPAPQKDAAA